MIKELSHFDGMELEERPRIYFEMVLFYKYEQ